MAKTLYLPDSVAQKMNKEKAASAAPSSSLDSAYVTSEDRVLDPTLLEKPLLDRLPQPTGWRLLVMPYQGKAKTASGLYIPDEIREREAVATQVQDLRSMAGRFVSSTMMKLSRLFSSQTMLSKYRGHGHARRKNRSRRRTGVH